MSQPPIGPSWIDDIKPPYGTVTGQFIEILEDSDDDDLNPDVQPLNGVLTLTPTAAAGRIDDAFAQIRPVRLRIFGGQIVDSQDQPGARVLSTDADLGVAVQDWAWTATFQFDSGLKLRPFSFKVPAGETVNLTSGLVPVDGVPFQIIEGRGIKSVTGEDDVLTFTYTDGKADEVAIPVPDVLPGGMVPIFATLAEAEAWEAANPGQQALTLEPSEPDVTPPLPGTLGVATTDTEASLTVSGASDDRAVTGYAFRRGNEPWSAWQSTPSYTMAGLSASTQYTFQHKVTDGAGNEAIGTAVTASTAAAPPPAARWTWEASTLPDGTPSSWADTKSGLVLTRASNATATVSGGIVTFDGGGSGYVSASPLPLTGGRTIVVVAQTGMADKTRFVAGASTDWSASMPAGTNALVGAWAAGPKAVGGSLDSNWHVIAVTFNPADAIRTYLDGAQVATGAAVQPGSTLPFSIGSSYANALFSGMVREVQVFDQVVAPDQVATLSSQLRAKYGL